MGLLRSIAGALLVTLFCSASLPASAVGVKFTATPDPVAPGHTVTFTAAIDVGVTVNDATVTLWFYNSAGGYVGSASQKGVDFIRGQSTPVTISYAAPSSLANDIYTYNLSFYSSSGGSIGVTGQTNDGSFTVARAAPSYTITPDPNPAIPGQTITFNASLDPQVTVNDAKVTLWFYNSAGGYVGSASATGVDFTAGRSTPVTISYPTSARMAVGTYTYNLSYYDSSGSGVGSQTHAGSFSIASSSGGGSLAKACASAVVVGLRWSPVSGAASYDVWRNGSKLTSRPVFYTYYNDQTVTASSSYTYSVTALNSNGSTVSTQTLGVTTAAAAHNGDPAYCPSSVIASMTWNWAAGFNQQNGSDLWGQTWGADGNSYTFFGDGAGLFGDITKNKTSYGIGEFTGSAGSINASNASNVYGGQNGLHPATIKGKAGSIIAIGSDFYAIGSVWQPNDPGTNGFGAPSHSEIEYSTGNAYSWKSNYSNWIFCSDGTDPSGFCPIGFVQFGAGYSGAPDGYVYIYGTTAQNFFRDALPGPAYTYLARVPKNQLLTKASYEVFSGLDSSGNPTWNADWTQMRPVFTDRGPRPIAIGRAVYNLALHRFIGIGQGSVNQAVFYDAPNPWGPWTSIGYYNSNSDNTGGWGNLGSTAFQAGHVGDSLGINFINKWTSASGLTMWAAFSSNGTAGENASLPALAGRSMDSLSLVSVTLTLR
jgi:hypothetical protein